MQEYSVIVQDFATEEIKIELYGYLYDKERKNEREYSLKKDV